MNKRFTHNGIVIVDHLKRDLIYIDGDENLLDLAKYVDRLQYENEQLKQDRRRLIGYLWKYTNLDEEEIQEDIFNRELLDEYCPDDLEFKGDV